MHITLIGISNIGKSHWSGRLADILDFERIDCDMRVEEKLAPELKSKGFSGIQDVAKWMGQPYDAQYGETSRKYLSCEDDVMRGIIERLETGHSEKPLVIDTTGSVIYLDDDILQNLKALTRIIYLDASPDHVSELFRIYMNEPKPVIWGSSFSMANDENHHDALARCYPDLLQFRAQRYQALAHKTIPFEQHRSPATSVGELLNSG